jgi:hypothetical protein
MTGEGRKTGHTYTFLVRILSIKLVAQEEALTHAHR